MENLTSENFDSTVKEGVTIIDFWASWCGPCKMMGPVFEETSKDYEGKVKFAKLNVDEQQETAGKFGVMSIPTLIVFKDGKEVNRFMGFTPKDELKSKIDSAL
jgi:thioredoxin 1